MATLVSTDHAILAGLAHLGRHNVRKSLPEFKVEGPWGMTPKAAECARVFLREIVPVCFQDAGGAGVFPFPNPADANRVTYCCSSTWRRWSPEQLAFRFGPVSLRLAGMCAAAGIDPPLDKDDWLSGDVLIAWRFLGVQGYNRAHMGLLSRYSRLVPWFWLGSPDRELPERDDNPDLHSYFQQPLLPFLEALQPWIEKRWSQVLREWPDLKEIGRSHTIRAWRMWRDTCLAFGRPDLVRGMVQAAHAVCGQMRWINALREHLPVPGSVSFQVLGAREADLLAIGTMLEEMALFRDRAEELVYIDETYASATTFKLAVPPEVRDRLRQSSVAVGAMSAMGRMEGVT